MDNKKRGIILVSIASIIMVSILVSAGFWDIFKFGEDKNLGGELAESKTAVATVNVTLSPNPPRVIYVSKPYDPIGAGGNVDLNRAPLSTVITFSLLVYNPSGSSNLPGVNFGDDVTLYALGNFTSPGEATRRINTLPGSCSYIGAIDSFTKNYSCNVTAEYYDEGGVDWRISVQFADLANRFSEVNDSTTFKYVNNYFFSIFPAYVNWTKTGLVIGSFNTPSDNNITIINEGNKAIALGGAQELSINATELWNASEIVDPQSRSIGANNFTGNEAGVCSTNGFTDGQYFTLDIFVDNGPVGLNAKNLTFCAKSVPTVPVGIYQSVIPWRLYNSN